VIAAYHGEVTVRAPDSNDHVLHVAMIARANAVWEAGGSSRDPWIPY